MAGAKIETLPEVREFKGLYFDPGRMMITVEYAPVSDEDTLCRLKFHFSVSDRLTGWLVELYERLTADSEHSGRLKALHLQVEPPKGSA